MSEEMDSKKAIQDQHKHYDAIDIKRQDFLIKINTLNKKIEGLEQKGVYK